MAEQPVGRDVVAAEREIQIVARPGGQRDHPAAPELLHRLRDVRPAEVLGQAESKHPAEPDRHVRVTRQREVHLQREAEQTEPGRAGAEAIDRHVEHPIGHDADNVRDQELLAEADDDTTDAVHEVADAHHSFGHLMGEIAVMDDRTCDERRKKREVQRRVHKSPLGAAVATVHVNQVGDRVQSQERNTKRKQHTCPERLLAERQG